MGALVAGDREINPIKLKNVPSLKFVELAGESIIEEATGGPLGFSGPMGLNIPLFADKDMLSMEDFVVGGNEKDIHIVGVNPADFKVEGYYDLKVASAGDPCPRCGGRHRDTGHRGRPYLQARDEIQRGDERDLPRSRRTGTADGHGLLRHRGGQDGCGGHRAEP